MGSLFKFLTAGLGMHSSQVQGTTCTADHAGIIARRRKRGQIPQALAFIRQPNIGREVVWEALVHRLAHRNNPSAALEALFAETRPFVFGRALRILRFRADAEEITMDVYSQVWRIAERYNPQRGDVLAWLLNMATSRALDRLRRLASRGQLSEVPLSSECESTIYPDYKSSGHVHRALLALSFEQQRAIELAYFEGYSMAEIALRLGHPVGTVKSRIRSALIELRRHFGGGTLNCP